MMHVARGIRVSGVGVQMRDQYCSICDQPKDRRHSLKARQSHGRKQTPSMPLIAPQRTSCMAPLLVPVSIRCQLEKISVSAKAERRYGVLKVQRALSLFGSNFAKVRSEERRVGEECR